jgi:hypothetical protein
MVQYISEQMISNVDEFAWDEDPSIVMDFDDEDMFSYTGNDSFISIYGNESESTERWKTSYLNHTDTDYSTTKNIPGFHRYGDESLKPPVARGEIPLVDMLDDIISARTMELQLQQQQGASSKSDTETRMITLDEQLEMAQRKLEESIRQSQITRPKFIQFSDSLLKSEECSKFLLTLKSKQCNGTPIMNN